MAAFALEEANLVWQKVNNALANSNHATRAAFKGLKEYLAQQKGNPKLQMVAFTAANIDDGGAGEVLGTGTTEKFYAVYAKRVSDVDTTAAWLRVDDDATDNSGVATDALVVIRSNAANEHGFYISPDGEALTAGIVVSAATAVAGTTESAATESSNGFVIVGA